MQDHQPAGAGEGDGVPGELPGSSLQVSQLRQLGLHHQVCCQYCGDVPSARNESSSTPSGDVLLEGDSQVG